MPNLVAYLALIIWPFVAIRLYKRLSPVEATFWTIFGGFLLLPVKTDFDFPFIPPLNKSSIPVIMALIGCVFIKRIKIRLIPKNGPERWLIIVLLITPLITVVNNQEPINFVRGLTLHDAISAVISQYLGLLAFIIGIQLVKKYEDQLLLFKLLVIAALFYSIPILYEVRFSPQLHTNVYGFFPHNFVQQMREGGFRPVVFLGHGLIVALFIAIALGASSILMKAKNKIRGIPPLAVTVYLFLLLLLCKSLGAFLIGVVIMVAILWMPIYAVNRTSLVLIAIVILYPFLSIYDLFPHQQLVQLATDYDTQRGDSLAFRFRHEGWLLDHARQKLLFGWGGWGRNRLDHAVTDGYWIIKLGQYGLFGFISLFGLLVLGVWKAIKSSKLVRNKRSQQMIVYHALIISVILVDQIPNASLNAWAMFLAGGLLGRANSILAENKIRQ